MNKIFKILALTVCILSGYISYAQSSLTVRGTTSLNSSNEPLYAFYELCTLDAENDVPLIYADYYFLEALLRKARLSL